MDDREFRRLLNLFPVVRPRDFHLESELAKQASSQENEEWDEFEVQGTDQYDVFWEKLRLATERKMGAADAEKFCKAFRRIHNKLVYKDLSLKAAQIFVNSSEESD